MSTRIALAFREADHPTLSPAGLKVIRVLGGVRFLEPNGWSEPYDGIIDTGAPVSVIPKGIWARLQPRGLGLSEQTIGLAGHVVPVDLAEVQCALVDEHAASPSLSLRAYLCKGPSDLLVLGMEDFLTRGQLQISYASRTAYVEFP